MLAVGGHLVVLQIAAWSGMLVRNARESTVMEAVIKTFDGRHPCSLCQLVEKESQRNQDEPSEVKTPAKLFLVLDSADPLLIPRFPTPPDPETACVMEGTPPDGPPLPPPRSAV